MADPVQWTIDRFYDELRKLDAAGRLAIDNLNAQKQRLQDQYTLARTANDTNRMEFLKPLISKNSALRLSANDYKAKFNDLVGKASSLIRSAGFAAPPTLSGLGFAPAILVPIAWIVAMVAAWAIVNKIMAGREAIEKALNSNGPTLLAIAKDPDKTAAERKAALDAYNKLLDQAGASTDWIKDLAPVLGLVAVIVIAPSVLRMLPQRRSA